MPVSHAAKRLTMVQLRLFLDLRRGGQVLNRKRQSNGDVCKAELAKVEMDTREACKAELLVAAPAILPNASAIYAKKVAC